MYRICIYLKNTSIHNLILATFKDQFINFYDGLCEKLNILWIYKITTLNPYPAKITYLNFQPLEVVSRYRDPQPQVIENYSHLFNLRTNIYKS